MSQPLVTGLIAAPFTPMHRNGGLNLDVVEKYVDVLLQQNVRSVYVNGTTGEGLSLTLKERKNAAEKWIEVGKGRMNKIIIQVGASNFKESQELARHAAEIGADVIATLPPFFFKPSTIDALVDYLAEIASVAPHVPFFYYHIPEATGVQFAMYQLLEKATKQIPNFSGVKFTSFDLADVARCVDKYSDQLTLCYGKDEQFAFGLMLGCQAGVGSTYNYFGNLYNTIYEAVASGDFKSATKEQIRSAKMIGVMFDEGFDVGVNKSIMQAVTGLQVGPPRLPLYAASKEKVERIMKCFKEMGLIQE